MTGNVNINFGLVDDQVRPALEKQNKEYKVSRDAINQIEGSYRELEGTAVRALKRTASEQSKINRVTLGLKRLVDKGVISQERMNDVLAQTKARVDGTAAAREKDQQAAEKIVASINPVRTKQREIVRLLRQELLTREQALAKIQQINAASRTQVVEQKGVFAGVTRTLGAYIGVQQAVSKTIELLERQRELEREGFQETLSVAQGQAVLTRNTAGFSSAERTSFIQQIEALSGNIDTATVAQITEAAAKGVSATTSGPRGAQGRIEDTLIAVEQAAKLFPDNAEAITPFTQAILDLQKATRGVASPDESLELLQRAGSQARIVDTENLRNLVPALQAIRVQAEKAGEFEKEDVTAGLAFQALVGSTIADPTGEITRTTSALFAKTLADFVPQAKGFADQLELVRKSPGLQNLISENLQGRGVAKGAIEQVVRGLGDGGSFDDIVDALNKPGESVVDFLRTGTPELRQQLSASSSGSRVTDFREKKFGDAGSFLNAAEDARRVESAPQSLLQSLGFSVDQLFLGTKRAAELQLQNQISGAEFELRQAATKEEIEIAREQLEILRSIKQGIAAPPNQQSALPPERN